MPELEYVEYAGVVFFAWVAATIVGSFWEDSLPSIDGLERDVAFSEMGNLSIVRGVDILQLVQIRPMQTDTVVQCCP